MSKTLDDFAPSVHDVTHHPLVQAAESQVQQARIEAARDMAFESLKARIEVLRGELRELEALLPETPGEVEASKVWKDLTGESLAVRVCEGKVKVPQYVFGPGDAETLAAYQKIVDTARCSQDDKVVEWSGKAPSVPVEPRKVEEAPQPKAKAKTQPQGKWFKLEEPKESVVNYAKSKKIPCTVELRGDVAQVGTGYGLSNHMAECDEYNYPTDETEDAFSDAYTWAQDALHAELTGEVRVVQGGVQVWGFILHGAQ